VRQMEQLKQIHAMAYENERAVCTSKECGCFYCKRIFDGSTVTEWVDDANARKPCALIAAWMRFCRSWLLN